MSLMDTNRLNFDTPSALASALADRVAAELSVAIVERKQAVLAVSGGKTPELFFHYLAKADIDWKHILVTLVDERLVPAAFSAASRINSLPRPFDVIVLGMGTDGHTASFFPGGDRLKQAIDTESRALVLPIHARGLKEARLTLTLPVIVEARFIALHIEGQTKLDVFERALQDGPVEELPIRAVLKNTRHPVQVYWSPNEEEKQITDGTHSLFDTVSV